MASLYLNKHLKKRQQNLRHSNKNETIEICALDKIQQSKNSTKCSKRSTKQRATQQNFRTAKEKHTKPNKTEANQCNATQSKLNAIQRKRTTNSKRKANERTIANGNCNCDKCAVCLAYLAQCAMRRRRRRCCCCCFCTKCHTATAHTRAKLLSPPPCCQSVRPLYTLYLQAPRSAKRRARCRRLSRLLFAVFIRLLWLCANFYPF